MNALSAGAGNTETEGGPMWGRFFDSIGHDDNDSVVSGSNINRESTLAGLKESHSEVHPNDSASMYDEDPEVLRAPTPGGAVSAVSREPAPPPVDDGTYVFKFSTPSGRTHRFHARKDGIEIIREIVSGKLATDPFFTESSAPEGSQPRDPFDFHILYKDSDGDIVVMTSDGDVEDAVSVARSSDRGIVVLTIQGGKGWKLDDPKTQQIVEDASKRLKADTEKAETAASDARPKSVRFDDDILGVPRDLVLPASLGVLAVVIIGVFAIHRFSE